MAALIFIAAYALMLVGGIIVLIGAFRESIWWGLACLFLPIVSLFFIIVHWDAAKKGVVVQLFGIVLFVAAFIIGNDGRGGLH